MTDQPTDELIPPEIAERIAKILRDFGKLTKAEIKEMANNAIVKFTPQELNDYFSRAHRIVRERMAAQREAVPQ